MRIASRNHCTVHPFAAYSLPLKLKHLLLHSLLVTAHCSHTSCSLSCLHIQTLKYLLFIHCSSHSLITVHTLGAHPLGDHSLFTHFPLNHSLLTPSLRTHSLTAHSLTLCSHTLSLLTHSLLAHSLHTHSLLIHSLLTRTLLTHSLLTHSLLSYLLLAHSQPSVNVLHVFYPYSQTC